MSEIANRYCFPIRPNNRSTASLIWHQMKDAPISTMKKGEKGIITGQDYCEMLPRRIEKRLKFQGRLKLFFVLDGDFCSYETAWDDARFGLLYWSEFEKIALATDIGWIRHGTKIFAPLMKVDLQISHAAELKKAKAWICRYVEI